MDKPLFSEHWYRVKSLKPQLRAHAKLHRHEYRGEIWYVLQDNSNSRFHRFNAAAYQVIGLMNGQRTVDQIWLDVNTLLGDDAPVQDELIRLLGQLHSVDALQTGIPPDVAELVERGEHYQKQKNRARIKNPLSVRLPLFDPDRMLDRALPLVQNLFSWPVLVLWILLVGTAVLLASSNWATLIDTAGYEMLAPGNLLLLWLTYPVVKLLHELGHGFAAKLEGGEVHEMGIMFLVFVPVPYVDASAATAFADKRKRMLVGAAGVMVELLLASLALFLWLNIEPGLISSICFNVMLIGGVSTLLFNGNPLLRFDGYYVLSDAIGIPNLSQRANNYLAYLIQHRVFGMEDVRSPVTAPGEARWFVFYSIASFCYRIMILGVICFFLINELFFAGVLLASWVVLSQLILPLAKQINFVLFDPQLRRHRYRALLTTLFTAVALVAVTVWMPVDALSRFEGVVRPSDESHLVAETDGFVVEMLVQPGATVTAGQALIQIENNLHAGEMAVNKAKLRELTARHKAARVSDKVQANVVKDEIAAVEGELARTQEKLDSLLIRSPADGIFLVPRAEDLPGQFVRKGSLLGYVLKNERATVRVVVSEENFDRNRQLLETIEARMASNMDAVLPGRLLRQIPQASVQLPSKVLSVDGGGLFVLDPGGKSPLSTRERVFEFEVELPLTMDQAMIGTRVYVRFDHGSETLSSHWYRKLRQLFLRRLNA
jgi:putative peptide zinc metalloprotease protein